MNPEEQVIELMKKLLDQPLREDRTGTGTYSSFGERLEFDLSDGSVPVLTTKKVYYKSVVEELLFFIRGETDTSLLKSKIWRGNTSREFLDRNGLGYPEGEMGPLYGFQWRHFGADYRKILALKSELKLEDDGEFRELRVAYLKGELEKEKSKGTDQLSWVISEIKSNPLSRRLIVSAWNAEDVDQMVLPPCHVFYQFYVREGHLDIQVYQRSADVFLGLPFNLASYGTLLHMMAQETGYKPGRMVYIIGDAHIYSNHASQVKLQISREPYPFPKIEIEKAPFFEIEKIGLIDYNHHPEIKGVMSV